jgi:hypothetical protein
MCRRWEFMSQQGEALWEGSLSLSMPPFIHMQCSEGPATMCRAEDTEWMKTDGHL